MKKTILIFLSIVFLTACGAAKKNETTKKQNLKKVVFVGKKGVGTEKRELRVFQKMQFLKIRSIFAWGTEKTDLRVSPKIVFLEKVIKIYKK